MSAEEDQLGGYRLPTHSLVMLSLHGANRSPIHWDQPDTFDPDRFANPRDPVATDRAFLAFSSGSRRCIGAQFATTQAKLVLARLSEAYRFELQPDSQVRTSVSAAQHPNRLFVRFRPLAP